MNQNNFKLICNQLLISKFCLFLMFFLNLYDYHIPQQILGLLIVLGIPLMVLSELYLVNIRKISHAKIIFGVVSIILGSVIIIITIWGDIGWQENRDYSLLGFDYSFVFGVSILVCIFLVTRGIILIHRSKSSK